jgi:hypothetical protein
MNIGPIIAEIAGLVGDPARAVLWTGALFWCKILRHGDFITSHGIRLMRAFLGRREPISPAKSAAPSPQRSAP